MGARLPTLYDDRGRRQRILFGADGEVAHAFAEAAPTSLPRWSSSYAGTPGGEERWQYVENPGEHNAKWADPRTRIEALDLMPRREPVVFAALVQRTQPIVQAEWFFEEPTDATPVEQAATEECQEAWIEDPYTPFERVASWTLEAFRYGFAVLEGRFGRVGRYIRPLGFEYRHPYSIVQAPRPWVWEDGRVVAVEQTPMATMGGRKPAQMRLDQCIHAVWDDQGLPDGNSGLRAVYREEYLLDRVMLYASLAAQRYGVPMLVGNVGELQAGSAELTQYADALKRYRSSHEGYVLEYPGQTTRLLEPSNSFDLTPIARMYREGIALALQVPHLLLGTAGSAGSWAMATELVGGYIDALEYAARWLAGTIQHQMVDRLVVDNFGFGCRPPKLKHADLRRQPLKEWLDVTIRAAQGGVLGEVGEQVVSLVREKLGLPAEAAEVAAPLPPVGGETTGTQPPQGGATSATPVPAQQEQTAFAVRPRWQYRREPRGPERCVDFAAIVRTQDDATDAAQRATARHQRALVDALTAQVLDVVEAGDINAVQSIAAPPGLRGEYRDAFANVLREVRDEGRRSVAREVNRAEVRTRLSGWGASTTADMDARVAYVRFASSLPGATGERHRFIDEDAPPSALENADALLREQARRMADAAIAPLEGEAQDEALRALNAPGKSGTLGGATADFFRVLREMLAKRAENRAAAAASQGISQAFATGREQRARELAEEEEFVVSYSDLADENTCEFCAAAAKASEDAGGFYAFDGSLDRALSPPLKPNPVTGQGCAGSGRCRCIRIFQRRESAIPLGSEEAA